jgi:hypothetical protein
LCKKVVCIITLKIMQFTKMFLVIHEIVGVSLV